jgi:chromate transporter
MVVKAPPAWVKTKTTNFILLGIGFWEYDAGTLEKIALFFTKAGAFVFGSGLAIVPFLHSGVVDEYKWLSEQQFIDAVAVAMITPGPVVITVGFIGYLVAGFPGSMCSCAGNILTLLFIYHFTGALF